MVNSFKDLKVWQNSTKEYIQFLYIALGSACEVETQRKGKLTNA